ncbi:hypothetical protein GFB49_10665 [Epibacterium sp. SM1979]|uniref:Uncharacterized protein n=1 Tax=Tritonibacter litoralis TaxID=2662264 RepID=A0A843YJP3_9RHOB|nr:hypothetical protein [Tritonibacter litoralis]MQQ08917.1 hypothetical protein [Tritonibacter litoralis]
MTQALFTKKTEQASGRCEPACYPLGMQMEDTMVEQLKRDLQTAIMHIFEGLGLVQRARVQVRRDQSAQHRQIRSRR